jgi:hypothetical protein
MRGLERPLGKGEVVSSILTGSTTEKPMIIGVLRGIGPTPEMQLHAERCSNMPAIWHVFDMQNLVSSSPACAVESGTAPSG